MRVHRSSGGQRRWRCSLVTALLPAAVFLWADLGVAASRPQTAPAPRPRSIQEPMPPDGSSPTAEVTFAAPQRFAIVNEPQVKWRRLYGKGDVIPDGRGPDRGLVVEEIETTGLRVREVRSQKPFPVAIGAAIPGAAGRLLAETILLEGVNYRYVNVKESVDLEPRVIHIQGRRAWLEIRSTVSQPALAAAPTAAAPAAQPAEYALQTQHRLDATVLGRVRVKEAGRDAYEISAADVRMAMNHAEQVLMETWSTVRPMLSWEQGVAFRVQSPIADGVLGAQGFKVTSPNLAERAGIALGDVILAVNDQPINGFSDLFRLYRQVKADPRLSAVQLKIERQGQLVTKTYRIR
jgi:hypothetical protein